MKKILLASIIVLSIGCVEKAEKGEIVARVNDSVLTLEKFYNQIPPGWKDKLSFEEKSNFVSDWVDTELFYREAVRRGIGKDEKVLTQLETLKKEILKNELLVREIEKSKVTEQEVKSYYETHKKEYDYEIKIATIFLDEGKEAQEIFKKIKEGHDFAELAKQHSRGPMADRGGETDYFRRHSSEMLLSPKLEEVAFSLNVGKVTDVIKTNYGYYIIKLVDKKKIKEKIKFEDVEDDIEKSLTMMHQNEVYNNLLTRLRKGAKIEIYEEALKK